MLDKCNTHMHVAQAEVEMKMNKTLNQNITTCLETVISLSQFVLQCDR